MTTRLYRVWLLILSLVLAAVVNPDTSAPANAASAVTIFDGTYQAYEVISVTVTIPTNPPTKKTITTTSPKFNFAVVNGKISGGVYGFIVNASGTATMTVPVTGYGTLTITVRFVKNSSTHDVNVTGNISGQFPAARTVISGKFYGHLIDKLNFTVPSSITPAKIGKRYPGFSFCVPTTTAGRGCGWPAKSTNPTGGKPPYTFGWKIGSDLLPTGLVLNFRTGQISGTPRSGLKPRTYHLIICAYDSVDLWSGTCRATNLVLGS